MWHMYRWFLTANYIFCLQCFWQKFFYKIFFLTNFYSRVCKLCKFKSIFSWDECTTSPTSTGSPHEPMTRFLSIFSFLNFFSSKRFETIFGQFRIQFVFSQLSSFFYRKRKREIILIFANFRLSTGRLSRFLWIFLWFFDNFYIARFFLL